MNHKDILFIFMVIDTQSTVYYAAKNVRKVALGVQNFTLFDFQFSLNQISDDDGPSFFFKSDQQLT